MLRVYCNNVSVLFYENISRLSSHKEKCSLVPHLYFLSIYFPCTGSYFAIGSWQTPIPGVHDFPQIISCEYNAFYYTFDEMAPYRFQKFEILNEAFNDTHRWQTFTLPIYVDDVPEGVEELKLILSLLPDASLSPRSVNVTPAITTVRIHDFDSKFVGKFDDKLLNFKMKQNIIAVLAMN